MAGKSDYSPVVEERGQAETRRRRRLARTMVFGAHSFWLYAVLLAGIILLVVYLTGGFGEGGNDERNGAQAVAATSTDGTSPHSSSRR